MKVALQYTPADLRRLVAADATSLGYAVLPDEVDVPEDLVIMVQFEGVPTPPAPKVSALSASPGMEPNSLLPRPPQPVSRIPPSQEGAWTSQPASGADPRYTPIDPPSFAPRTPRVREIGQDTGLVQRETGTEDGRPRGWRPPSTEHDPVAPSEDQGPPGFGQPMNFLDEYLKGN